MVQKLVQNIVLTMVQKLVQVSNVPIHILPCVVWNYSNNGKTRRRLFIAAVSDIDYMILNIADSGVWDKIQTEGVQIK